MCLGMGRTPESCMPALALSRLQWVIHLRGGRPGRMPLPKLTETLPTYPCNLEDPPGAHVLHDHRRIDTSN